MFAKVEAGQAWLEEMTYQMVQMSYRDQSALLAGRMAALKFYLSHSAGEMAEQAVQSEHLPRSRRARSLITVLQSLEDEVSRLAGSAATSSSGSEQKLLTKFSAGARRSSQISLCDKRKLPQGVDHTHSSADRPSKRMKKMPLAVL